MVAVVAAMGGEVERDREALLSGREVAAIEGVGIFRGRETGILPDRPRLRDVHRRVGAAQVGRDPRIGVEEVEARDIVRAVERLHRNALGGEPGRGCRRRRRAPKRYRRRQCLRSSVRCSSASTGTGCNAQNIMRRPQRRQDVAAREDERLCARRPEFRLPLARPSGQIKVLRACSCQCLGGGDGFGLIDRVGRAQAGDLGARRFECGNHRCRGSRSHRW